MSCSSCGATFVPMISRKYACRGCDAPLCGSVVCKLEMPIEQHGHHAAGPACLSCAAPSLAPEPGSSLRTAGGDVLFVAHNVGAHAAAASDGSCTVTATWDGAPIPCDFVRVSDRSISGGMRLRCTIPAGVGRHTLTVLNKEGRSATLRVAYSPPTLLRIAALPSSGGVTTLMGENLGASSDDLIVFVDGVVVPGAVISNAHKEILFSAPAGEGATLLRIDVGGQAVECYAPRSEVSVDADAAALFKRLASEGTASASGASPLTSLFSEPLPLEQRRARAAAAAAGSPRGGATPSISSPLAAASPAMGGKDSPVVRGPLGGAGPTLSITAPSKWQADTLLCSGGCGKDFGLTRRRHHCRVCGLCVCATCSPYELRLSSSQPPVRVCTRCNLRVGLLTQMTGVVESVENLKKVLAPNMWSFFVSSLATALADVETAAPAASSSSSVKSPTAPASATKTAAPPTTPRTAGK